VIKALSYLEKGDTMSREKFTKTKIDSIKYSDNGQVIYWDTDTPGLGLVVGARTKTFRLQLDVKDSSKPKGYRTIKKTLGRYGAEITLEQAKDMVIAINNGNYSNPPVLWTSALMRPIL
jgi:hypothetical protein